MPKVDSSDVSKYVKVNLEFLLSFSRNHFHVWRNRGRYSSFYRVQSVVLEVE